ncbi:MAG: helix-turn-helix domain-containing protein [Pseudonocardiaceae bacterium]
MQPRTVKLGEVLTSLIERGGYSRNRQAILATVGVSAAALSQYARDETRPSFRKLVALADFFGVSLDYLVFGGPTRTTVDHGPLARHVDRALAAVQTRANRHSALVTRIGRVLADRINEVAREVADSPTVGRAGLIQDDETLRLERYAGRVHFLTLDLAADLVGTEHEPVGGALFHVVAANLLRGCEYRFLVAGGNGHEVAVSSFRALLSSQAGGDRVHQFCDFRSATTPVMLGAGFYQLDVEALALQEPTLHAQIGDDVDEEGWLGYAMRTNTNSKSNMLMDFSRAKAARQTFDALWSASDPL